MKAKRIYFAFSVLLIAILACNVPGGQASSSDLAATITAQALALQAPSSTPTALALTASPSAAQASVTSPTNCRSGPSTAYDLVFTANPGQTYVVIGKNTSTNYWIINNPAGGSCWLWGQNTTVTGDSSSLPDYPAPPAPPKPTKKPKATATPTSTGGPVVGLTFVRPIFTIVLFLPTAPGNLSQSRSCSEIFQGVTPVWVESIALNWQASAGETGYKVYENGNLASTLSATSTSYHTTINYNVGTGGALYDTFGVEAYNNAGASQRPSIDVPRCP